MAPTILESLAASNIFDLRGVGIGMMISSTLVANGATVYIVGPEQADLDKVCATYNAAAEDTPTRGRMHGLQGDIRLKVCISLTEATRLAAEIGAREEKGITVLFNNAGILRGRYARPPPSAKAADYVAACFDAVSEDDFTDNPHYERGGALLAHFRIVMTSSMNGWTKDPATGGFSYPYLFSKSALGHATASLAHELLPLGIRVNGIAPGLFATRMTTSTSDPHGVSVLPASYLAKFEVPTDSGVGSTRDMGALALFLVANWFVNGETVLIDGGTLLKHPSSY
ncbi:hypothetical protein B0H14DRAFT_3039800 [Mycena olivaceomarginata]|nr:hypothetical protein B0H14DRAFT_3039800 [Mycena olivaceomarginata]